MIQDEDFQDDDVVDPEDPEVELEEDEAELDFNPDADKIPEEEEEETLDEALDEPEEDESDDLDEQTELTAEELAAAEEVRKYRILSPIRMGNGQGEYPVGVTAEFPTVVGDMYVEEGRAERVQ